MVEKILNNIGILIPSLDPDEKLVKLMTDLSQVADFSGKIVIVDDGTVDQTIFERIEQQFNHNITILHHEENFGKGAALKTGFRYFIAHFPNMLGIATLDSDGQHTLKDLKKCLTLFAEHQQDLIIGSRSFSKDIPFRSRFGNIMTNNLVKLLTGLRISDTQTGLRVIPINYAQRLLDFPGERFEFEFDMLLKAKENNVRIYEQPIETIYIDDNASSHFRIIRDSVAIYFRFIKFALSGLVSFVIDIGLFALIIHLTGAHSLHSIMVATIVARFLSAIANYLINHHIVFEGNGRATLVKYAGIMVVQMLISGYVTHMATIILSVSGGNTLLVMFIKMVVDFALFIVSYQVQKRLIFAK